MKFSAFTIHQLILGGKTPLHQGVTLTCGGWSQNYLLCEGHATPKTQTWYHAFKVCQPHRARGPAKAQNPPIFGGTLLTCDFEDFLTSLAPDFAGKYIIIPGDHYRSFWAIFVWGKPTATSFWRCLMDRPFRIPKASPSKDDLFRASSG